MPFEIKKQANGKWKLFNLHKNAYAKASFNSKQTAINQGINYGRYRKETLILNKAGNKLIKKKGKTHVMPDGSIMAGAKHKY